MTFPNPQSPAEGPRSVRVDTSTIPGWGVDADPENDPTWPMRDRDYDDAPGRHWTRPPQQIKGRRRRGSLRLGAVESPTQ